MRLKMKRKSTLRILMIDLSEAPCSTNPKIVHFRIEKIKDQKSMLLIVNLGHLKVLDRQPYHQDMETLFSRFLILNF